MSIKETTLSDKQMEQRTKGIGGTDAGAILGQSPYKSPLQVYLEKTGEAPPKEDNDRMKWGRILEDPVADDFSEKSGLKLHRVNETIIMPGYEHIRANIDRRVVGAKEGVEIKTVSGWVSDQWEEGAPPHYVWQCIHYMLVTGWQKWHLVGLLMDTLEIKHYEIERDEEAIKFLQAKETKFWYEHVLAGVAPLSTGLECDSKSLAYRYARPQYEEVDLDGDSELKCARIADINAQLKDLKHEKDELQNQLKQSIGDARYGISPSFKADWNRYTQNRFDSTRFKRDHPELYKDYVVASETSRFQVRKQKRS